MIAAGLLVWAGTVEKALFRECASEDRGPEAAEVAPWSRTAWPIIGARSFVALDQATRRRIAGVSRLRGAFCRRSNVPGRRRALGNQPRDGSGGWRCGDRCGSRHWRQAGHWSGPQSRFDRGQMTGCRLGQRARAGDGEVNARRKGIETVPRLEFRRNGLRLDGCREQQAGQYGQCRAHVAPPLCPPLKMMGRASSIRNQSTPIGP